MFVFYKEWNYWFISDTLGDLQMICRRLIVGLILLGLELACSTIFWDLTMLSIYFFLLYPLIVWFNCSKVSIIFMQIWDRKNRHWRIKFLTPLAIQCSDKLHMRFPFALNWRMKRVIFDVSNVCQVNSDEWKNVFFFIILSS